MAQHTVPGGPLTFSLNRRSREDIASGLAVWKRGCSDGQICAAVCPNTTLGLKTHRGQKGGAYLLVVAVVVVDTRGKSPPWLDVANGALEF